MEHHKRQDPTSFQTVQLFELRLGAGTDPGAAAALDAGVSVGAGAVAVAVAVAVALLLLPRPRARRATDSALGSALGIFPTLTPFNAAALVLALALLGGSNAQEGLRLVGVQPQPSIMRPSISCSRGNLRPGGAREPAVLASPGRTGSKVRPRRWSRRSMDPRCCGSRSR